MKKQERKRDRQERVFGAEIREVNPEKRSLALSFSSDTPYRGWWGTEILSHEEGDVSFKRLEDVGTVLFNHGSDPNYGKMPIARIDKAWIDKEEGKGRAEVTFDDDDDSAKVFDKISKGMLKGVSVGYVVHQWEDVMPGKKSSDGKWEGAASIARDWEPIEISIVATPADPEVGVGRESEIITTEEPEVIEEETVVTVEESKPEEDSARTNKSEFLWNLRKKINT